MTDASPTLYCANHPNVETSLRCKTCGKPICPKCAVLTPTGYSCRECLRGQQRAFDTAEWYDYPLAFFLAGFISLLGSFIVGVVGFFTIFIAPIAGMIIAETVRFVVRKRRSPQLFTLTAIGAALGSLPLPLLLILSLLFPEFRGGSLIGLLWQGLYAFTVTSTVYYRLRGVSIR